MSEAYKNTNINELAKKAEQDVNSTSAVHGHEKGDSSTLSLLSPLHPPPFLHAPTTPNLT